PVDAPGKPLTVTYPDAASWKIVTHAATPQVLRLRLTDVPGWHASIDGRPLPLTPYNQVMLQARVPAGIHTIKLHYWPGAFTAGIVLAALTLVGLMAVSIGGKWRSLRRSQRL
ncbi:MAG: YfhO family protein, partial [Acidimicrobiales bacterium]